LTVFCRANLNYLPREGPGGGGPSEVEIHDGRSADLPGWEECGFELLRHASSVPEWADDQIAGVHYVEMEELACKLTGADVALVSGHITRSPQDARRHHQLSPITFVHSDFAAGHDSLIRSSYRDPSERAAAALERNGISSEEVAEADRLLILQFWRNLGPAKMDHPIAFCDVRTVDPSDGVAFRVTDYAGTGFDFDALGIRAPEGGSAHRWYAFPAMQRDEVVAFRTYDTDLVRTGGTYFTPHSAFRDPGVPLDHPPRWSIELRATCLYW